MTTQQTALREVVRSAYERRSVLVAKTLPEHRTLCATCGGRIDPRRVCIYQLCDYCLGGEARAGRVSHGEDKQLEGAANAYVSPLHELPREAPISSLSAEIDPAEQVTEGANGVGNLTRTGTSRDWEQPPHRMLTPRHSLSEIDEEHRLAYCAAHGHRVRVVENTVINGVQYWRCLEQNTYRDQSRQQSLRGLGGYKDTAAKCCGDGGACAACPLTDTLNREAN